MARSIQAQAASAIRKELKESFPAVKFQVRSESFAGGNAVRISWTDGPTLKEVDDIAQKYQYGHFDGMADIYEHSNSRDDIPQVKYVQSSRNMSEATRESLKQRFNREHEEPYNNDNYDHSRIIYREFSRTSCHVL